MKLFDIVSAYNTTNQLSEVKDLSPNDQWSIYKFRKDTKVHVDFYNEKIEEIKNKYLQYADKDGNLKGENFEEYIKEIEEINNIDIDFEYEKKNIKLVNGISFTIMENLENFFEFTI